MNFERGTYLLIPTKPFIGFTRCYGLPFFKILLWAGIVKPTIYMENQQDLLNAIATLSASIDPLMRAEKKEEVTTIVEKLLELVAKLK
jgi:hypothetical protein